MLFFLAVSCVTGIASAINLNIASKGGNASSTLAYGIMFEDINHSGDGGLYAELIQNRAFQGSNEHPTSLQPWVAVGDAQLSLDNLTTPLSWALPTSVQVESAGNETIGILNPGWWGIDVKPQTYTGSFWVLGSYEGSFTAKLQSSLTSKVFATATIQSESQANTWVQHNFTLTPHVAAPNINNTFSIEYQSGQGPLNFNLISLFPPTYNNRPNGLRIDLMEALKALNPSFLRMPGGNNIEGDSVSEQRWKWNETIGPLTERPGRAGTWGYENTDGLGLIEYLQWCDDLEMEPILAVWSGVYLNGYIQPADVVSQADLAPYVQDTLNELEFIMGDTTTTYGALRASLGYPKPWTIKYVEIGNEDNISDAASYASYRYAAFASAITGAYPNITVISSTGDRTAESTGSATDYHQYTRPDIFVSEFGFWDTRAEADHPALIGEYATIEGNVLPIGTDVDWSALRPLYPSWVGAVSEAIFAIGAERNSYGIIGMSYAPLLQNMNSYEWAPDLISFTADQSEDVLSTSHHVISLLSNSRYSETVPVTISSSTPNSTEGFGPSYWVAGTSGPGKFTFKVAVYNATETQEFNLAFEGLAAGGLAKLTVINAEDGLSFNSLRGKEVVRKKESVLTVERGGKLSFELENYSVAVLTT